MMLADNLCSLPVTQDGIEPEIMLHADYMKWFHAHKIPFKAWGSAGPDFLISQYNLIGEVKREDTLSALKAAVKELYERSKQAYKICNFHAFFVVSGSTIRYYTQTNKADWRDVDLQDCVCFSDKERDIFLSYMLNNAQQKKVQVEDHLDYALSFLLDERYGMCVSDSLKLLFNLGNDNYTLVKDAIYFNPNTENEIIIELAHDSNARKSILNFLRIFTISDVPRVKDYIKFNYSSHLPDSKKANLGKYYTPKEIVETLKSEIEPKIQNNTVVMDLACGCGAFLELFDDCHIIGRDIDEQAIEILDLFNFSNIEVDNTLLNVGRSKYGLDDSDDVIIVGNPPYNDTSSINKRYSTKAKSKRNPEDKDIHCRDIGRSFLEAYAKLRPRYICVLHPLAFLTKRVNFNNMKYLYSNYVLENATIFKSTIFKDLHGGTPFPIIIATYRRDPIGMTYQQIKSFVFNIYGSEKKFSLSSVEQAGHDFIHQTVTSVDKEHDSDIGLYHYNFRDINSLNKANFQNEAYRALHHDTMLVVNYADLWKYCYVNCIKKFLLPMIADGDYYILGNLNPIINREQVENSDYWKDLFIICAILKNSHRLDCMNIENRKNNMLTKRFLLNDFKRHAQKIPHGFFNFYLPFFKFMDTKDEIYREQIYKCVIDYFTDLIGQIFI